jgi:hypothetical protein
VNLKGRVPITVSMAVKKQKKKRAKSPRKRAIG